jgi:Cytochrome c oxidase subunit IV
VAEELRFFLRTAVYSAVVTVIYWFASYPSTGEYDWAGTVMLAFTALASAAFVAAAIAFVGRRQAMGRTSVARVDQLIGLTDPDTDAARDSGEVAAGPLGAGLEPVPLGSVWPPVAGLAALMIAFGFVFGAWLLLPGIVLGISTTWAWITQFDG